MKKMFIVLFGMLLFAGAPLALFGQYKLDYNPSLWETDTILFEEEFNYTNLADLQANSRFFLEPNHCGIGNTDYSWDHVDVDDGLLTLTTEIQSKDSCNFERKSGYLRVGGFQAGGLQFNDSDNDGINDAAEPGCTASDYVGFYYGLFEIRCKLPVSAAGSESHAAFWLDNGPDELDISEYKGDPETNFNNIHDHTGGSVSPAPPFVNDPVSGDPDHRVCGFEQPFERDLTDNFHTWTMVWTDDQITFFFDGKELRTETRFEYWLCPTGLIINAAEAAATSAYEIDYVKVVNQTTLGGSYLYYYDNDLVGSTIDVYNNQDALVVGGNDQIFYRSTANRISSYYLSGGNYVYGYVMPSTVPSSWKVSGDLAVGEGNRLYYRGTNGKIHTYSWSASNPGNGWGHDLVEDTGAENDVSFTYGGSIAAGEDDHVFFRGTGGEMKHFYLDQNGDWQYDALPNTSSSHNVEGGIAVGGGNQVFYRGGDGRLQTYYFSSSSSSWVHDHIDDNWGTTNYLISSSYGGQVIVGEGNRVFYRGSNGQLMGFYFDDSDWVPLENIPTLDLSDQAIAGKMVMGEDNQIFYRGADGTMQTYYQTFLSPDTWYHNWVDDGTVPSTEEVSGALGVGTNGGVNKPLYRNSSGHVRSYEKTTSSTGDLEDQGCNYKELEIRSATNEEDINNDTEIELANIDISPNPSISGIFNGTIRFMDHSVIRSLDIQVFTVQGQLVKTLSCDDCDSFMLDLSMESKGIYFVQITIGDRTFTRKLITS